MKNLKQINQTQLKDLLKERIENPAEYISRPLLIWESLFYDGIQERILEEVFYEINKKKDKETRQWYKAVTPLIEPSLFGEESKREDLEDSTVIRSENSLNDEDYGKYNAGLIVIDLPVIIDKEWLTEFKNLLKTHKWEGFNMPKLPFVVYMCSRDDKLGTPSDYPEAEQYVFEPDFEEWSLWARKKGYPEFILDFIRGNGEKEEIFYRWYNRFKYNQSADQSKGEGCRMPKIWERIANRLRVLSKRKGISDIKKLLEGHEFKTIPLSPELYNELIDFVKNNYVK